MPLPLTGTVGAPSNTSAGDGASLPLLQGKQAEAVVVELHGKYYTQAYRNNTYWASTAAAGLTLSAVTNTASTDFILWNPQGSGKNCVLIRALIGVSTAATAGSNFAYGVLQNAGSGVATAAPFSVFTQITATRGGGNLGLGFGQGSSVALIGSAATLTAAAVYMRTTGAAFGTGAITVPNNMPTLVEDFDGLIIVPPGVAFFIGTPIAGGQTATNVALHWEETPL